MHFMTTRKFDGMQDGSFEFHQNISSHGLCKVNLLEDMDCHKRMKWTLYSSIAALFIFLSVTEVGLLSSMKNILFAPSSYAHQKYVIVFDGGSTGTRVHVFSFTNNTDGLVKLQDEYFEETKPGLSSFAAYPKNAALSVHNLLEKAKSYIPSERWCDTPVFLKATAGLRLLPTQESKLILEEVANLLESSPFHSEENSVSVLDGEDEGIFAWFTLNFLLGHLDQPSKSVALLDLGGGSTQVTFAPVDLDSVVFSPANFIINRRVYNRSITIYSHSYLGLGLMSARLSILRLPIDEEKNENDISKNYLHSPCIAPDTETKWKHGAEEYVVMGSKLGTFGFAECYERIVQFLDSAVHKPSELWKREVYGISYYFDRAFDMGIIADGGGIVTVGEYIAAAVDACSKRKTTHPFLCLDASYISAFLHHGLGFSKDKEIKLVKQIDGIEASWGLGAAFSVLK